MKNNSFFYYIKKIKDIILNEPINNKQINYINSILNKDNDVKREFWNLLIQLKKYDIIKNLYELNFFKKPPEYDKIKNSWPFWTESFFLSKMIVYDPRLVTDILLKIETQNPHVINDIINSALNSSEKQLIKLSKKIVDLIKKGGQLLFYSDEYFKLIFKVYEIDSLKEIAFDLSILYLRNFDKLDSHTDSMSRDHFYMDAINKLIPLMCTIKPIESINYLCDELIKLIRNDKNNTDEFSYIWRPAIEDHEQNHDFNLQSKLISPLRNACKKVVKEDKLIINDLLKLLEEKEYLIFKRLQIHLINIFAEKNKNKVKEVILNKDNFEDYKIKHEYAKLVGDRFNLLNDKEQKLFKSWIEKIPTKSKIEKHINYFKEQYNKELTQDEINSFIRNYKYNKYWWIRNWLTGKEKEEFEKDLKEFGKPELADLNTYSRMGWGVEEPVPYEETKNKTFKELIDFIKNFKFKNEYNKSIQDEGLYSLFEKYIKEKFEYSIQNIKFLKEESNQFTKVFFKALFDNFNLIKELDLTQVFSYAIEFLSDNPYNEKLSNVRDYIRIFIDKCLRKEINLSLEYKNNIWEIIINLLNDPDKNYILDINEREEEIYTKSFIDHSLNNPKCSALRLVFDYTRWILNNYKKNNELPKGWGKITKVKEFLNNAVKYNFFTSFGSRSIIGENFGLLNWIDQDWLKSNIDYFFDLEKDKIKKDTAYGWGAWNTFLIYMNPHIIFYNLLKKQFYYAIEKYKKINIKNVNDHHVIEKFIQHIVLLYGRGNLPFEDKIVQDLFLKMNIKAQSYAFDYIGRNLKISNNAGDRLSDDIKIRIVKLWDWYWYKICDKKQDIPKNLFGYLYISRCFDKKWAIDNLHDYVNYIDCPEPNYEIHTYIAEDSKKYPIECTDIIYNILTKSKNGWLYRTWTESIYTVLENGIKSRNKTTIDKAEELIDQIGRLGGDFLKFGELLNMKPKMKYHSIIKKIIK